MRIGDWSSDVCSSDLFGDVRLRVSRLFDEAPAQMAPAMHERPWSLRPRDAGEPIIAVIAVALQELSSKALQELFAMDPTASGRISEQHDWRVSATVSAIVGG